MNVRKHTKQNKMQEHLLKADKPTRLKCFSLHFRCMCVSLYVCVCVCPYLCTSENMLWANKAQNPRSTGTNPELRLLNPESAER